VEGLAAKLLAELPGQLVEYFHDMRRMPPPAAAAPAVGVPQNGGKGAEAPPPGKPEKFPSLI
jgi:hypothetical protein